MPFPLPGTAGAEGTNADAAAAVADAVAGAAGPLAAKPLVAARTPTASAAAAPSPRILRTISISLFELPESMLETVPATGVPYPGTIRMSRSKQAGRLVRRAGAGLDHARLALHTTIIESGSGAQPARRP